MTGIDDAEVTISIALVSLTTLATIATIGIAFLLRPGRATLYWTFGFTLAMTATFTRAAGDHIDWELVGHAGLGAVMGTPAFLWSGFRSHWGARPHVWAGVVVTGVSAVSLTVAGALLPSYYTLTYRCIFLFAALFAALFVADWLRLRGFREPVTVPFAVVSLIVIASAVVRFGWTILTGSTVSPDNGLAGLVASVGMLVYVGAAAFAVVGLTWREYRTSRRTIAGGDWAAFQSSARDRLLTASRSFAPLSLVYVRLDDLDDIRRAAGPGAVLGLTAQIKREVLAAFPAGTLVDSPGPGIVVALTGGEAGVRDALRALLERITTLDVNGRLPIQPSASTGWAPTSILGFDLNTLLYMGREAATVASQAGGDRWERVGAAVTDRILNQSVRR